MIRIFFILSVFIVATLCVEASLTLSADTPWIVSAGEPEAVQRALDDVAADWYKVLGYDPIVLREPPENWRGPVVYLGLDGPWLKDLVKEPWAGAECFVVRVEKDAAGRTALVATGSDVRGAIYAAYALSEELLGVDPWYFWTDHEPAFKGTVEVPEELSLRFGPPTFEYRGWFINDEDLFSAFCPDPMRENVFSLEMYDRIFETVLRLRGNMAVPATFAFPDEQSQVLAARRGLALNMHHIQVVGLNTYRWPADVPYSYQEYPEILTREWQRCVDFLSQFENVWTVGYRGKHDRPFWVDDPSLDSPEKRGALISRAIAAQVEMIRKKQPDAMIISNLWMEGATLYHAGHIEIPTGVVLVWPDDGAGVPRDGGQVKAGQGVYYHTAMLSSWHNQLSEMVPPGRIYAELGRFVRAGATRFFLVNLSDVRPVPLSTDCAMKFVWDASAYIEKSDQENRDAFLLDWSRRQFGAAMAAEVARVYGGYFDLPTTGGRRRGISGFIPRFASCSGSCRRRCAPGRRCRRRESPGGGARWRWSSRRRAYWSAGAKRRVGWRDVSLPTGGISSAGTSRFSWHCTGIPTRCWARTRGRSWRGRAGRRMWRCGR
ncbi:glycosyl hydrolase 115 family protein [bacterium]|nr:glycosyl hydrolase 115 family protein [bacterium]